MNPKILEIYKRLMHALNQIGSKRCEVHFCTPWLDARTNGLPSLTLFVLEETPLEYKARSYKQELSMQVEAAIQPKQFDDVYLLAAEVKRALLNESLPFSIIYLGYEITLPDDGAKVVRILLKFKVIYCEQI